MKNILFFVFFLKIHLIYVFNFKINFCSLLPYTKKHMKIEDWKKVKRIWKFGGKNIKTFTLGGKKRTKLFSYIMSNIEKYSIQNHITLNKIKKYILSTLKDVPICSKISVGDIWIKYIKLISDALNFRMRKIDYKLKL